MVQPRFLITIDTEGDNLWASPAEVRTENSRYLPRFQALCEKYALKPTWLVNHEMARCPVFVPFAQDVLRRGTGEVGMHLHAWDSPPLVCLTANDARFHPYLIEYPVSLMERKIAFMTELLEDVFGMRMVSHRAGRWALNGDYARLLVKHGYRVDCSVTPHVSWRSRKGAPQGQGGADYRDCPEGPYHADVTDPRRPGHGALLEVPMTIRPRPDAPSRWLAHRADELRLVWRVVDRVRPLTCWLRPNGRNLAGMLWLLDEVTRHGELHAEFMLHSSELMPGGSPTFPDARAIERLYADLEALFAATSGRFVGATLSEFHDWYVGLQGSRTRDAVPRSAAEQPSVSA